jgi:hypothetical protein
MQLSTPRFLASSHSVRFCRLLWPVLASCGIAACGGPKKAVATEPGETSETTTDGGASRTDREGDDAGADAGPQSALCKLPRGENVPFKHSEKPKLSDVPTDGVYVSWDGHTYAASVKVEYLKSARTWTLYARVEDECNISVELPFEGEPALKRDYKNAWGSMKGVFHVPNKNVAAPTENDVDNQAADGARVLRISQLEPAEKGAGKISGTVVATGKNAEGRQFWLAGVFKAAPYFVLK